ncbi:MAG TPA: glycosyltransferase [Ktedonobacterales bacterium]
MRSSPLDIALLAPLVSPIRQPYVGGAQALLRDLAVGLAQRGRRVTLYAATGSDPAALPGVTLVNVPVDATRVRPTNFSEATTTAGDAPIDPAVEAAFASAFALIASQAPRHDIIHAHAYDAPAFRRAQALGLPVVHTLHLPALDPSINALLAELAPAHTARVAGQPWLATVSNACAATYTCRIDEVIYNGIDVDAIPFGATADSVDSLLFAGRITPEKGVEDAIAIALAAKMHLTLVGGVYDQRYFSTRIQPLLAAHADALTYLGPQPRERVWNLMAQASAVVIPSLWDEPFGLVACEAHAAGAPIVGYDSGGLREIVVQGETGILVSRGSRDQAAQALADVIHFNRRACRTRVETQFSLDATITAYEALYLRMYA